MYQDWIGDSSAYYLSGAFKIYDFVVGSSLFVLDYHGFNSYGSLGELEDSYSPFDLNWKVAISADGGVLFDFLTGFSVGATLSLIERKLIEDNSVGMTFDLGINYETSLARLQMVKDGHFSNVPIYLGFSLQNLGFSASAITPVKSSLGVSMEMLSNLMISMDMSVEYGRPFIYKMGAEYTLWDILILRTGFNLGKDTGNLNFGLGVKYDDFSFANTIRMDYSFSFMGAIGNNHNISLYLDFPFFVDEAEMYYQKGIYHFVRGEYEKAREYWYLGLEVNPEHFLIKKKLENLERLLWLQREAEEGEADDQTEYIDSAPGLENETDTLEEDQDITDNSIEESLSSGDLPETNSMLDPDVLIPSETTNDNGAGESSAEPPQVTEE